MAPLQITINKPSPPAPSNLAKPDSELTAILVINGQEFKDWETVWIKLSETVPPFYSFRFTCSEDAPVAKNFNVLRIKPGDHFNCLLAGQPVMSGLVSTRQVFYDGRRHYVELQGSSKAAGLAYASHVSKTMEYKNVTYEQYARALVKPFGINFLVQGIGQLPSFKFPRISIPHGMSVLEALELPLRSLGSVNLTSNHLGDLVANVGPLSQGGGNADFVEGRNILEGRELIYNPGMAKGGIDEKTKSIAVPGQKPGTDKEHGAKAAHDDPTEQEFEGFVPDYRPAVTPMDQPAWDKDHNKGRAGMEHNMMTMDEVTVFITVFGWVNPNGSGLWKQDETYSVESPMLLMKGDKLKARSVTFTQDNSKGSRTVLELCNDQALSKGWPKNGGGATTQTAAEKAAGGTEKGIP